MEKIPLIHITDLYHPAQDPDDHFDLATVFALKELDLKAVLLDATKRFIDGETGEDCPRDPGFIPVSQLSYLTGQAFPVAVGPQDKLKSVDDDCRDRPIREQGAVNLLLKTLENANEPVTVTCVGSVRIIAAAYNRNSILVKEKIKSIYLNAGSSDSSIKDEWNVNLDINAWKCLFASGLNIELFPCTGENGPFAMTANNTFWKTTHKDLIGNLPQKLRAWFQYALTGNQRGDFIKILAELGNDGIFHNILPGERNMWSTASIVMAAGRVLGKTENGWRFIPGGEAKKSYKVEKWFLENINYSVGKFGELYWELSQNDRNVRIFRREITEVHATAMKEALNTILNDIL